MDYDLEDLPSNSSVALEPGQTFEDAYDQLLTVLRYFILLDFNFIFVESCIRFPLRSNFPWFD